MALPREEHLSAVRRRRKERGIWQRRCWEHTLRDEKNFQAHVDYVHINPVKHGLVERVEDWPYPTFHRYVKAGILSTNWTGGDEEAIAASGERVYKRLRRHAAVCGYAAKPPYNFPGSHPSPKPATRIKARHEGGLLFWFGWGTRITRDIHVPRPFGIAPFARNSAALPAPLVEPKGSNAIKFTPLTETARTRRAVSVSGWGTRIRT